MKTLKTWWANLLEHSTILAVMLVLTVSTMVFFVVLGAAVILSKLWVIVK